MHIKAVNPTFRIGGWTYTLSYVSGSETEIYKQLGDHNLPDEIRRDMARNMAGDNPKSTGYQTYRGHIFIHRDTLGMYREQVVRHELAHCVVRALAIEGPGSNSCERATNMVSELFQEYQHALDTIEFHAKRKARL